MSDWFKNGESVMGRLGKRITEKRRRALGSKCKKLGIWIENMDIPDDETGLAQNEFLEFESNIINYLHPVLSEVRVGKVGGELNVYGYGFGDGCLTIRRGCLRKNFVKIQNILKLG